MYVHSVYQLVASSFSFIYICISVCWVRWKSLGHHKMHIIPSAKTLVPPFNTKHRLSWQALQPIYYDFRFVKLDLHREHIWNPNELQHLSWPYDQHHPFNTNSHFWIPQMASPCYHLILFTFLLYEYWNNKFLFVQISYIMSIVQKKVEGCTN